MQQGRVRSWRALMFSFRGLVKEAIITMQEPLELSINNHSDSGMPGLDEAALLLLRNLRYERIIYQNMGLPRQRTVTAS